MHLVAIRSIRPLITLIIAITMLFPAGCGKEYSFEANAELGGTSVFTLVPQGTVCATINISGSYAVGTATSIAESVEVDVNVTTVGSWTYSTGIVNGFSFSGSGTFANTGSQTMILYASGTPSVAGSSNFPLNINGNCQFAVIVGSSGGAGGGGGGGGGTTTEYYFKATFDGTNYHVNVDGINGYELGAGVNGTDDVAIYATIAPDNEPPPPNTTSMSVAKGLMSNYIASTDAQFKAFFPIGDVPFPPPGMTTYENGNGVSILWRDKNGAYWSSSGGTVNQVGSTCKIVSVVENPDAAGRYGLNIKFQFSCKVYKEGTGEMRQLTNAEFVGWFGK